MNKQGMSATQVALPKGDGWLPRSVPNETGCKLFSVQLPEIINKQP